MDRQLSYVENRLVCGIKLANWKVHESATKDPMCKGMGTTMVTCMPLMATRWEIPVRAKVFHSTGGIER